MADTQLRELERRHIESPADDAIAEAWANALRRSGEAVPYELRIQLGRLFTPIGANACGMQEYKHKTTGMIFVLVPAGEFMMGPNDGEQEQLRRVFDEPFLVAKYPWTGREWHRITGELPSHFPTNEMVEEGRGLTRLSEDQSFSPETRMELGDAHGRKWGDHPVESISWDRCREVEDWINRLDFARWSNCPFTHSDQTFTLTWQEWEADAGIGTIPVQGQPLIFSAKIERLYQSWLWNSRGERCGFQLPTESMWEYVARAGTTTRYPNGDSDEDLEKIAWFGGDWEEGHKAVGLKDANNWGLHDNCGNVFEWTRCMWRSSPEESDENGFIAVGEVRPDPTSFINDVALLALLSASSSAEETDGGTADAADAPSQETAPSGSEPVQPGEPASPDPTLASSDTPSEAGTGRAMEPGAQTDQQPGCHQPRR